MHKIGVGISTSSCVFHLAVKAASVLNR